MLVDKIFGYKVGKSLIFLLITIILHSYYPFFIQTIVPFLVTFLVMYPTLRALSTKRTFIPFESFVLAVLYSLSVFFLFGAGYINSPIMISAVTFMLFFNVIISSIAVNFVSPIEGKGLKIREIGNYSIRWSEKL